MKLIAFVVKGLSEICTAEIKSLPSAHIILQREKYIIFDYAEDLVLLEKLKTIDDVALLITKGKTEELTTLISQSLNAQNLLSIVKPLIDYREILNYFSITASIFKNKLFTQDKSKELLSNIIKTNLSLEYRTKDHSNLDFRINIEENEFILSVKIFSESLYSRNNKFLSDKGSIRPTIAAGMIQMGIQKFRSIPKRISMIDLFCGTGTFLYEAMMLDKFEIELAGNDIDEAKVKIAKNNLKKVSRNFQIGVGDAMHSNFQNSSFNFAIGNFPWGKQIQLSNKTEFFRKVINEYARISKPETVFCFITKDPSLVRRYLSEAKPSNIIQEVKLGYLGQTPTITLSYPK